MYVIPVSAVLMFACNAFTVYQVRKAVRLGVISPTEGAAAVNRLLWTNAAAVPVVGLLAWLTW